MVEQELNQKNDWWLKTLLGISDQKLLKLIGHDAYLYLMYLRFIKYYFLIGKKQQNTQLILLFVVALSSIGVLFVYLTYSHAVNIDGIQISQDNSILDYFTLLAAQNHPWMLWVVIVLVILISIMGHILIYRYDKMQRNLYSKSRQESVTSGFISDVEISQLTLMIKGLN